MSALRRTPLRPTTLSTDSWPTLTSSARSSVSDLPLLGDIRGLRGVHLQCHIGTDTISLARLGARMTGLDFSPASLAEARRLAERTGDAVDFVEAEVYDAPRVLGRAVRPRLHGRRSALLAALGPPLGRGRGGAPAAGRTPLHPRGPSDAVSARRSAARRPAGGRLPLFRAGGADCGGGERHLRPDGGNLQ